MERITKMTLTVFAPSIAALLGATVLAAVGWNMEAVPLLTGLAEAWARLVDAALLAAVALFVYGAFRLWQWTRGRTLDCPSCAGLLGRERDGRYGPYRRCLGCGKNIARINYA